MGFKISLVLFILLSYSKTHVALAKTHKEKIRIVKNFALCNCILKQYHLVDSSADLKDVSLSILMNSHEFISLGLAQTIDSTIDINFSRINTVHSHTTSQIDSANQIFIDCTTLINSKQFLRQIIKLLKQN